MTLTMDVVSTDASIAIESELRIQASACLELGSPLSYEILMQLADLASPGEALAELLSAHELVRANDQIGLRLLAVAHRLVLARVAPALGVHFPTVGGTVPTDANGRAQLRVALSDAFLKNPRIIQESVSQYPQGNETGRSLPLRGALGRVATAHGLPIRLHELAASAGLNLRVDSMPWAQVPLAPAISIVERVGCDLHPLDARKASDRLTLASYVFGDDLTRFERLRSSFVLAHRIPVPINPTSAGQHVISLAQQEAPPGRALVLWHSEMWAFLDRAARTELRTGIRKLAAKATPKNPLVHLSWESLRDAPDLGNPFALVGRSWPAAGAWAPWKAGTSVQLGCGPSQGTPVRWSEPKPLPSDPLEH